MSTINPYTVNNSFKERWKPCFKGASYSCKWILLYKPDVIVVKVAGSYLGRIMAVSILLDTTLSAAKTQKATYEFFHEISLDHFKTFSRSLVKTLRGSCFSSAVLLPLKGEVLNSVLGIGGVSTILITLDDLYTNVTLISLGKNIGILSLKIAEDSLLLVFTTAVLVHKIGTPWILLLGETLTCGLNMMTTHCASTDVAPTKAL